MTLILFSFALPLIIGYVLFVGISGRLWPFRRPAELLQRPAWFFGLWAGASTTIVLTIALNMAYRLTASSAQGIFLPTAALLLTLLTPGFIAWLWYRARVKQEFYANHDLSEVTLLSQEAVEQHTVKDQYHISDESFGVHDNNPPDYSDSHALDGMVDSSWYGTNNEPELSEEQTPQALDEHLLETTSFEHEELNSQTDDHDEDSTQAVALDQYNMAFWQARRHVLSTDEGQSEELTDLRDGITEIDEPAEAMTESSREIANWVRPDQYQPEQQMDLDFEDIDFSWTSTNSSPSDSNSPLGDGYISKEQHFGALALLKAQTEEQFELDLVEREEQHQQQINEAVQTEVQLRANTFDKELAEIRKVSAEEKQLRIQAETHLRITRKALATLESNTRNTEAEEIKAKIEMEEKLAEKIRAIAIAEARADREEQARKDQEQELQSTRQALLAAKQMTSKNVSARAKALKTANKAITFARQTVDARAQVENEIRRLKETIDSQQATISSLINSLEDEQVKFLEEKSVLTRQLLSRNKDSQFSKDKEIGSLTARLVKRVARSNSEA